MKGFATWCPFDNLTDLPATMEQVCAALSREDYWLARHPMVDVTQRPRFANDRRGRYGDGVRHPEPGSPAAPRSGCQTHSGRPENPAQTRPTGSSLMVAYVRRSASRRPAGRGSGRAGWLQPAGNNGSRLQFAETVQVSIPVAAGRTALRSSLPPRRGLPSMPQPPVLLRFALTV